MHYLLFYDVIPDYATKRTPYRGAHLAYAQQAVNRGELILGGALRTRSTRRSCCSVLRPRLWSKSSHAEIPMCAAGS